MAYLSKNKDIIANTLKRIDINTAYIVLYDLIFYASLVLLPLSWNKMIMKHPVLAAVTKYGNAANLTLEQMEQITPMLGSFLFLLIASIIILALLIFLIYTLTSALIWSNICKKKFSLNFYKRFLLLNLAWLLLMVPAAIVSFAAIIGLGMIASSTRNYILLFLISFISAGILLIPIAITFLAYYYFTKQNKIFSAIKDALAAFKKIKTLALPLALIAITSIIISALFGLIPGLMTKFPAYMIMTNPAYMIIYTLVFLFYLIFLFYIALVRFYIITAAEETR